MLPIHNLLIPCLTALILSLILIPVFRSAAIRIGLIDKPNHRKVHKHPVPLVGGITIAISTLITLMLSGTFPSFIQKYLIMLITAAVMLMVGIIDDRFEIKTSYRLFIQVSCAYAIASSGVLITSLYGIFGIHSIPVPFQYALTIVVIVGVVNAFNLMDGIDGLLGFISIIGFLTLLILSFIAGNYELCILFSAIIGATIGFLRFNLSKRRIFLGDAGSIFIGFILGVSGIQILKIVPFQGKLDPASAFLIIVAIFIIPVFDSLRVYLGRMKVGQSPFTADKSHLHHLFLLTGLNHRKTAITISIATLFAALLTCLLQVFIPLTISIILLIAPFIFLTKVLFINKDMIEWKSKISDLEDADY